MNRYMIDGIMADLARGLSVHIVAPNLEIATHALDAVRREDWDGWNRATRDTLQNEAGNVVQAFSVDPGLTRPQKGKNMRTLVVLGWDYLTDRQKGAVVQAQHRYAEVIPA